MNLKVGDRVIFSKSFVNLYNEKGIITFKSINAPYFYRVERDNKDSFNVFFDILDETIELDKEWYRDQKLNELGI